MEPSLSTRVGRVLSILGVLALAGTRAEAGPIIGVKTEGGPAPAGADDAGRPAVPKAAAPGRAAIDLGDPVPGRWGNGPSLAPPRGGTTTIGGDPGPSAGAARVGPREGHAPASTVRQAIDPGPFGGDAPRPAYPVGPAGANAPAIGTPAGAGASGNGPAPLGPASAPGAALAGGGTPATNGSSASDGSSSGGAGSASGRAPAGTAASAGAGATAPGGTTTTSGGPSPSGSAPGGGPTAGYGTPTPSPGALASGGSIANPVGTAPTAAPVGGTAAVSGSAGAASTAIPPGASGSSNLVAPNTNVSLNPNVVPAGAGPAGSTTSGGPVANVGTTAGTSAAVAPSGATALGGGAAGSGGQVVPVAAATPPAGAAATVALPAANAPATPATGADKPPVVAPPSVVDPAASVGGDALVGGGDATRATLVQAGKLLNLSALAGWTPGTATKPATASTTAGGQKGSTTTNPLLPLGGLGVGEPTVRTLVVGPDGMEDLKAHLPPQTGWVLGAPTAPVDAGASTRATPSQDSPRAPLVAAEMVAPSPIPEPTPLALLGLAALAHGARRLRRRAA